MEKNKSIELLLCIFFGWAGAHKFYIGKNGDGFLYLFTFGLFGIGWLGDTIAILNELKTSSKSTPVKPWTKIIECFKNSKCFIPTWIICIFMLSAYSEYMFGIGGISIGVILLIIQFFQKRNIFKEMNTWKENCIIKDREIEQAKKENEYLSKHIEKIEQKNAQRIKQFNDIRLQYKNEVENLINSSKEDEINWLKYKSENDAYIDNLSKELEYYKSEIDLIRNRVEEYCITDEEINKKKEIIEKLNKEFKNIQENKTSEIEEQLQKKYESISQELKNDYEKLILYYENETEKIKNKYDIMNQDLEGNYIKQRLYYKDKGKNLQKKYDTMAEELKENYDRLIAYYKDEIESIKDEIEKINSDCIIQYYSFTDYNEMTAEDCKNKLSILKQKEKEMRNNGEDIYYKSGFYENKRTQQRIIRKILRTFNAECNNFIFNIKVKNIDIERKKIEKSFETLNKLYEDDGICLTTDLLELKLEQITTIYTYGLKKQQEKEIQKAIKEQMTEEAKAQKEIEDAKKKVEKDLQQHLGEINRMMKYMQKTQIDAEKQLYIDKIKELKEKIKVLEANKEVITEREANAKAGFVYIISNIGSFGENIYKIGMTRRLEPMDRIKELSSASVPFEFDVHAMIFSSNAPELETTLHKYFANYAVNKINPRKEFYNIDIDEIEKVVKENYNDTVQFTKIPIATEYRQTMNLLE